MSQKEETVQKLTQLRSSLTSEESNALLDTIDLDLDTDGVSRGGVIGEVIGRQLGGVLGRRVGKRLDCVVEERFDSGTALAPVVDALVDIFKPDGTTDESSDEPDEASADEAGEDGGEEETNEDEADEDDNGGHEFEADLSEMSTGELQSLADQLMNELQQRNETE